MTENKNINTPAFWDACFQEEYDTIINEKLTGTRGYIRWESEEFALVTNTLFAGASVLDYGCGLGHLVRYIHARFPKDVLVTGSDFSKMAVALARKLQSGNYVNNDPEDLPIAAKVSKIFNVIIATDVIEHMSKPHEFIQKCYDALPKDGRLVLTTPIRKPQGEGKWSHEHVHEFSPQEMRTVLSSIFDDVDILVPNARLLPDNVVVPSGWFMAVGNKGKLPIFYK